MSQSADRGAMTSIGSPTLISEVPLAPKPVRILFKKNEQNPVSSELQPSKICWCIIRSEFQLKVFSTGSAIRTKCFCGDSLESNIGCAYAAALSSMATATFSIEA